MNLRPSIPSLLVALVLLALPSAHSQAQSVPVDEPWLGWHGPPADGALGVRFGMDRFMVGEVFAARGLAARGSRAGTLRYEGTVDGRTAEVLAEFHDDVASGLGGRLMRIHIKWKDLTGGAARALELFTRHAARLSKTYGPPMFEQDTNVSELETGRGSAVRLFRGVEAQTVLELKAPRPRRYDLSILIDSPQIHPELATR